MILVFHVIILLIDEICIHPLQRNVRSFTRDAIKELSFEAKENGSKK